MRLDDGVFSHKNLEIQLKSILCSPNSVVAFVGSPLRSDDRFGLILYDELSGLDGRLIKCEYGLESCLYEIIEKKPKELLIVDAVFTDGVEPGDIVFTEMDKGSGCSSTLTTHNVPLNLILDILKSNGVSSFHLLGVVVKNLEVGFELSSEIRRSMEYLKEVLINTLRSCPQ